MVEKLKNRQLVRQLLAVARKNYPEIVNIMLTERDVFMASNLRKCPGQRVMAVVGLAHLDGIEQEFQVKCLPTSQVLL